MRMQRRVLKTPTFADATVEAGMVPTPDNTGEVRAKGSIGLLLLKAPIAGDVMSDGARNIWWFVNAPRGPGQLGTWQTVQKGDDTKILGRDNEPIIKNRAHRMAATLPAVLATSFGVGGIDTEGNSKAVLPSDEDHVRPKTL